MSSVKDEYKLNHREINKINKDLAIHFKQTIIFSLLYRGQIEW